MPALGWRRRWRRVHIRPWECPTCKASNPYGETLCRTCGGKPPAGANPVIEDAAAVLIQALLRKYLARICVDAKARQVYTREYNPETRSIYYFNMQTEKVFNDMPLVLMKSPALALSAKSVALMEKANKDLAEAEVLMQARQELKQAQASHREVKAAEKIEKEKQELVAKWHGPITHSKPHGELLANWKGLSGFPDTFYAIAPSLTVLNLVGNAFRTLPEGFCESLPNLRVLGLSNCGLVKLPENVSALCSLVELNVMSNELTTLPQGIGELDNLSLLHVTKNRISYLPESFSSLAKLKRVVLEANPLKRLPRSFGRLKCTTVAISHTLVEDFPASFTHLQFLTSLTADDVELEAIPEGFGRLRQLRHCSLCNNRIKAIPDALASCTNLKSLWLNWNLIEEVKEEIVTIESLEDLRMEGNPLRFPTLEVIGEGVQCARKWFTDQEEFVVRRERKKIVLKLQKVLHEVNKWPKVCRAWLRCDIPSEQIGDAEDLFFAFPKNALFDVLIPAWNEKKTTDPFSFTEHETFDAIKNLTDAYGNISTLRTKPDPAEETITQTVMFHECKCLDSTRARVCVPPDEDFMCERPVELLKQSLVTKQIYALRESHKAEKRAVENAHIEAANTAAEYIQSENGEEQLNLGALRRATKQLEEEERRRFSSKNKKRLEQIKKKEDLSRERRITQLKRKRERKVEALTVKRNEIIAKKERLAGWELENCEDDIMDIEDDLANLQEDQELKEIEKEQRDADDRFEDEVDKLYVVQHRSRWSRLWPVRKMNRRIRKKRLMLRQEVCKQELVLEYIDMCQQEAEERVHYEFRISRKIMHNWLNLLVRSTFHSWIDFAEESVAWKRRKAREEEEVALVEAENERITNEYVRMERAKWEQKLDPYSDQTYWQHSETQQIMWEEPVVTAYIPRH